jgi:glc operon protein GlcG
MAMHLKPSIDFSIAKTVLAAALDAAQNLSASVSLAVVDDNGELVAFARMDGARSYTIDLALEKAKAAARLGLSTAVLETLGRRSPSGNPWSKGGLPILHQGQCAGAIGVSGAPPETDDTIAARAVAALEAS